MPYDHDDLRDITWLDLGVFVALSLFYIGTLALIGIALILGALRGLEG